MLFETHSIFKNRLFVKSFNGLSENGSLEAKLMVDKSMSKDKAKKATKSSDHMSASEQIDIKIADLGDWRGELIAEIRKIIQIPGWRELSSINRSEQIFFDFVFHRYQNFGKLLSEIIVQIAHFLSKVPDGTAQSTSLAIEKPQKIFKQLTQS